MINSAAYDYTVVELFEDQAKKTPNHIALDEDGTILTYQALNEKANQFSYWLQKNNVNPGEFVGILLDPGIDYIVCILGIIKAKAVYLPLDSMAPQLRLEELLQDAKPSLIVTNEQYINRVNEKSFAVRLIKHIYLESVSHPRFSNKKHFASKSPLYMMYTSGSTGRPKGVLVSHQAVVNLVKIDNFAKVEEYERVAQFSNLAFDGSTFEIWSALLNGATLVIVPSIVRTDHTRLKSFLNHSAIKYLFLPTGFFHQLIKSAMDTLDSVEVIIFGGEQVNALLLKDLSDYRKKKKLPIKLINGYGPTEATTFTCRQIINPEWSEDDERLASIGKPIKNVEVYILDENKVQVSEGELHIGGVNLAIHYHNSPLNSEKFIPNPFCEPNHPFNRLYKTGDRVKMLPSGDIQFLGRYDDQVKIGGFRIHLNEIENQLMQHPLISLAAVRVEIGGGSHKMLTAYIVLSATKKTIHADEIREYLSHKLPIYMLPAKYVLVDDLPLTSVGKVDKSKLDQISHIDLSFHIDNSPASFIEEKITTIWQGLLNRNRIDVNKNLFELGANSLLIAEACSRINEALQSELQISHIISYPTIHKLSRFLDGDIETPVVKEIHAATSQDIAIIGMACRFPKANSLDEYWQNILDGKDCLTQFASDQLNDPNKIGDKNFVPVRGVIGEVDKFDANFFGFNPVDASITDPQQRIFLECAWTALEHAGIAPTKLHSKTISVFAGMADSTYLHENLLKNNWFCKEHDRFHCRIASSSSMLSTQVSYRLNLRGKSLNVNTACSTGLVTVDEACHDLIAGESDISIAGAVSIVVPEEDGYTYTQGSIESPDGKCRPFDEKANGTVFSNGVGIVILKRLKDAIADKNTIYAVIKGRGINNDGADKLGFTAPSTSGQTACIREALATAKITAADVSFVEAHGTATTLGDAIEFDVLNSVYKEQTEHTHFCALGSVKGNIGHTDVAAGMAGLIKVCLSLYHQKIPPMVNFKKANPNMALDDSPFFINTQLIEWKKPVSSKRYAGVSAFGVGGTNAHMILGEYTAKEKLSVSTSQQLLVLSAKNLTALEENTEQLLKQLSLYSDDNLKSCLPKIAYTLQTGREDFQWRRIATGDTLKVIRQSFSQSKAQQSPEHSPHNLVFMFPGQGMQYHKMATQLMKEFSLFASLVKKGFQIAKLHLHCDLETIINNPKDERLHQTQYAQPALFIIEYALAHLLMDFGIKPQALIGHSLGEYVAAALAGVFSYEDAVALVCERGLLMSSAPKGAMLAIECSVSEFKTIQKQITGIELAVHNAKHHCVASGKMDTIQTLENFLSQDEISFQRLKVSHAFHSSLMETIETSFKEIFANITLSPPTMPIVSNVTGDWLTTEEAMDPDYWYRHLRDTVLLNNGFENLIQSKHSHFIEVGPGRSLSSFLKMTVPDADAFSIQTLPNHHQQTEDVEALLAAVGKLWQEGVTINWLALHNNKSLQRVALPTYSFQRQSYWIKPDKFRENASNQPSLYKPVWSHQLANLEPSDIDARKIREHTWIVFQDNTEIGNQLISLLRDYNAKLFIVEPGKSYQLLDSNHFRISLKTKSDYLKLFEHLKTELKHPILFHTTSCNPLFFGKLSNEEIDTQLNASFYSLLFIAQAYREIMGEDTPLRCGVLTQGTQRILGTELISPVNASLIGACRVISQEHPNIVCKVIDSNPVEFSSSKNTCLSHLLNASVNDDWLTQNILTAYRNGYQWDLSYTLAETTKIHNRFRDKGIYLITGGLGGIGLAVSELITEEVNNPTLIFLSRTPMLPETTWNKVLAEPTHKLYPKIKLLNHLKQKGADLYFYNVDIADSEALRETIQQCKTKFGAINGLIHCAGVAGGGLVQLKTREIADTVFRPKIHGTFNLLKAFKDISLDFVVLMSSIAALTGEQGQIDYCAANACLDAFALSNAFQSKFVISLNWNTWRDVGMAIETKHPSDLNWLDRGNDISPEQGKQVFLQALRTNFTNLAVSNFDIKSYSKLVMEKDNVSGSPDIRASRTDLNIANNYQAPRNSIESQLAQLWQESLGIENIGTEDNFFDLGGHSLKALKLIEKINRHFHRSLVINQLYQTPTIAELSDVISSSTGNLKMMDIIVPFNYTVNTPNLFVCHPISGLVYCFDSLTKCFNTPLSIYGLQDPSVGNDHLLYEDISSMAKAYLDAIKSIQPHGPYYLLGYSFGGSLLYEVAALLKKQKNQINLLGLIDSWASFSPKQSNETHFKKLLRISHPDLPENMIELAWKRMQLLLSHTPTKLNQDMLLFKASDLAEDYQSINDPSNGWSNFNKGKITCHMLDANHETILDAENSKYIVNYIQEYCGL
ncbi:type I polyketide synthase [Legionella hackeliae]|uniref:6-deoxyerythronolide-B synthase n=1 Tax=Legionella hackeliae TaxID=449 RepID=A0A0A8UQW5_LEGHA|nr:type I polyketide synthase [Legionella hackeliae]KTD09585.1 Polyketide synthase module [Legionella hackeliae]CEK11098.1 6-deoxyerythronolide-B synthase [Legionella hackeliae]STX47848.1 Polyketide synthase module [Legionella hackeliae]